MIADLCSGIYNSAFGCLFFFFFFFFFFFAMLIIYLDFSEFLGPFSGGILSYCYNFQKSALIISIFCLLILIIYFLFGEGYRVLKCFMSNREDKQ